MGLLDPQQSRTSCRNGSRALGVRPLPTLGRRPTPEATSTPKHKASPLWSQSQPSSLRLIRGSKLVPGP